jgi:uncharacterized protein
MQVIKKGRVINMRRKEFEVKEPTELLEIMRRCTACNLAFFDAEYPYIIPMNFGVVLKDGTFRLYFHGAKAGTKIDLLKKNGHVAFEMHKELKIVLPDLACDSSMGFESVCGNGNLRLLEAEEKLGALTALMNQYLTGREHVFDEKEVRATAVMELVVNQISGKKRSE